ncbi:hypothetical protein [Dichotomicrobium thermohalophilum]|uniref:hypothetical protein n=1 Tax=Dichotomicrobium thermohalophilum TaxID=933063 RepID=UPI000E5B05BB|nr:hypothetical protein [Dichotomicrobium thermohalophilum]
MLKFIYYCLFIMPSVFLLFKSSAFCLKVHSPRSADFNKMQPWEMCRRGRMRPRPVEAKAEVAGFRRRVIRYVGMTREREGICGGGEG